ncbi:Photosystem I assembly protein Ycf3 [Bienertia sinuspersici]
MEILLIRPFQLWPIFYYESFRQPQEKRRHLLIIEMNYYEAMRLEIDPYDRSYILYNIGLIHTSNGEHTKALEYYFRALERNPFLPQAFNNMAVICHYGDSEIAEAWFDQAAEYWKQAITLTPGNYIEAHNWLKITGRFE